MSSQREKGQGFGHDSPTTLARDLCLRIVTSVLFFLFFLPSSSSLLLLLCLFSSSYFSYPTHYCHLLCCPWAPCWPTSPPLLRVSFYIHRPRKQLRADLSHSLEIGWPSLPPHIPPTPFPSRRPCPRRIFPLDLPLSLTHHTLTHKQKKRVPLLLQSIDLLSMHRNCSLLHFLYLFL